MLSTSPPTEPFDGAWIQARDAVEAAYNGDKTGTLRSESVVYFS
jgi:hypothetical protein